MVSEQQTKPKTLAVYTVRENGEREFWTQIGVAFVNQDGSLNVKLNALPLEGKLHIREPKLRDEQSSRAPRGGSRPDGSENTTPSVRD